MLTLLHGDNLAASYSYLIRLKKEFQGEILDLEAKSLNEKLLSEKIDQVSLFAPTKLVVVSGQPQAGVLKELLKLAVHNEIVIWLDKKIGSASYQGKILEFKDSAPNSNFKLADCFASRDLKGCLQELDNLLKTKTPNELVIGVLARQIRLLLQLKDNNQLGLNPYVVSKLKPTLGKWHRNELINANEKLLELDHSTKIGKIEPAAGLFSYLVETV